MSYCTVCRSVSGHDPGTNWCADCGAERLFELYPAPPSDEVASLRAEVERLTRERDEAREERDDARRMYCSVEVSWRRANHEAACCPEDVARETWPDAADALYPEVDR
jgi:hypothetical protein